MKKLPDSQVPLWISGAPVFTNSVRVITDPARPSVVVGTMASAQEEDIEATLSSSQDAAVGWASLSVMDRADLMRKAIEHVFLDTQFVSECAQLLTLETGKILHESEVDLAVFRIRWNLVLELTNMVSCEETLDQMTGSHVSCSIRYTPLGVVVIIIPYNWPLAILAASLPAALLAGNSVVVKPPATAPLATTRWISRLAEILPAGVLSVLAGTDQNMETLITDHRVGKICFTGSVQTGKHLMEKSATRVGRLLLELGGNDAAIVCADAQLDDMRLDMMFHAIFDTSGQICMNIKRIYVHTSRAKELITGLEMRMQKIVLGHGLEAGVSHGPVHTVELSQRLNEMVQEAQQLGAEVHSFGVLPTPLPEELPGYYVLPSLVIDPPPESRIVVEEQFGPIIPIIIFSEESEAVAAANDTWAGLGASIWSNDRVRALRLATQIEAGYVWVNDHGAQRLDLRAPFGGMKQSGFGREQGMHGLREFMDTRTIAVTELETS